MRKLLLCLVFSGVALVALGSFQAARKALAQSGTRTVAKTPHYVKLWTWLRTYDYRKWNGTNGHTPDFKKGKSPHGKLIKTYINAKAASDLKNLPDGSVIVKENYSPDKKLMIVTVMQRSRGADPKHGDWYYAKYMPDGKIARTPPAMKNMPIAGSFPTCIECHAGAKGDDYAFLND